MSEEIVKVDELGDDLRLSSADLPKEPPRLHQSIATVLVSKSPLHAWYKAFAEEPETFDDTRNFGTVCHKLLLGGKDLVIVDAPDWRTQKAREERDAALASERCPVLERRLQEAMPLCVRVHEYLAGHGIKFQGQSEVTLLWRKNGVWHEGRLDHLILPAKFSRKKKALILDFKFTTVAATKKACENRFIEHGYDIQHAAYVEAVETLHPKLAGRVRMQFVFVEVNPPHAIRIMPVSGSMRTSGQWRWAKARELWKKYLAKYGTDTPWPGYEDDGEPAECPAWALNAQIGQIEQEDRVAEAI